jgi:hypothetical protein
LGALTYKNFTFELRGWEIQKKISRNPTSNFGEKIKILINNNKIIQIEPLNKNLIFISDKTRQFYDSLFIEPKFKNYNYLKNLIKSYIKILYFFNLYSFQKKFINFFCIVFENLGLDVLSLLTFFEQKHSFIKLIRFEQKKTVTDFENDFLINNFTLKKVFVSLLISTNITSECVTLNLKLKQRIVKGNFKFFNVSSSFKNFITIGSSLNILKCITEGTNFVCQDLFMTNSLIITNSHLFKRNDSSGFLKLLLHFRSLQKFCNFTRITFSIYETGIFLLNNFLNYFNLNFQLYTITHAINTTCFLDNSLSVDYRFKHRNFLTKIFKKIKLKNIVCYQQDTNVISLNKIKTIFNIPVKNFFESGSTFINNKGHLKITTKIINNNKKKSHWKLIRYIFNFFKKIFLIFNNFLVSFTKTINSFHFKIIFFLFFTSLNNLTVKKILNFTNSLYFFVSNLLKKTKLINSKLKYWLNDFFVGGLDGLSVDSLILNKCSENLKLQSSTFF